MKKLCTIALVLAASAAEANYEDDVKSFLKDPESAIFKDVRLYEGGGVQVFCGKVNSKNGFGGYTGFEYFISNPGLTVIQGMEELEDGAFEEVWNRFCRGESQ